MSLTETEFRSHSDTALEQLNRSLDAAAENYDVEVLYQNGVLNLEFEEPNPGKIVISPNAPARQIWISAQATSFKLVWNDDRRSFVFPSTSESLNELVGRLIGEQLGIGKVDLFGS